MLAVYSHCTLAYTLIFRQFKHNFKDVNTQYSALPSMMHAVLNLRNINIYFLKVAENENLQLNF